MPRHLDVRSRTDALLVAAMTVICRDGLRGLTLRAVAAESRVSAASIVHHFGGRARMDRVLARTFGHTWNDDLAVRSIKEGVHAFLPDDEADVRDCRVWQGWLELSRADSALALNLAGVRASQRDILDSTTDRRLDQADLDLLVAVVEGLVSATCAPGEPLSPDRAHAALARYLDARSVQIR